MSVRHSIWGIAVLVLALSAAWGQSSDQEPPMPLFGEDNPVPLISENPPISGLDMPNLEPHTAPLSYLQPGGHLNETVDSNVADTLGGSRTATISRAVGSLELRRLWSHYDLYLDYLGGVSYYNVQHVGFRQIEELGLTQKVMWKRGELGIRDAFSYQPEGTFGGSYGVVGATGAGLAGQSAFFGGTGLGALGQVPRLMNLSVVDVIESLTPKSSITVTGGYGFVHFLGNEPGTENSFIGSTQVSAQVGYSRLLGAHDQGALVYGYQGFDFSTGVNFHNHVIQVMWGHRISGRMDFVISVGPQFTQINDLPTVVAPTTQNLSNPACIFTLPGPEVECPTNDLRIGAAGRVALRYRFRKVNLDVGYMHYLTNGSGFFAGAESDIANLTASRSLGRIWTVKADFGYSRNSRVIPLTLSQIAACAAAATKQPNAPACPGVNANVYQYGYAGVRIHRMLGRTLEGYASYQFNDLSFDNSYCQGAGPCNRIAPRHVGTIGLDWIPRPTRLD
jgi:hypothetical protein